MPPPPSRLGYNWNPLLQGEIRRARREANIGQDAACSRCGGRTRAVLRRRGRAVVCYACEVDIEGRRATEIDHPVGRRRLPAHTAVVPANLNQLFNDPDDGPTARLAWLLTPSDRVLRLLRRR